MRPASLVAAVSLVATAATLITVTSGPPALTTTRHPVSWATQAGTTDEDNSGCGQSVPVGDAEVQVTSAGAAYSVLVHVPDNYQASIASPVVLNLHGSSSSGALQAVMTGMDTESDRSGFIVAYPDGGIPMPSGLAWNVPGVPLVTGAPVPDGARNDAKFIRDLLIAVEATYCVDESRIFATGMSGGARMASYLACTQAGTFAAVAPVGGVRAGHGRATRPQQIVSSSCRPTQSVAVLAFHGEQDTVNPYTGNTSGSWGYSVPAAMKRWAELDHCRSTHTVARVTTSIRKMSWPGCGGSVKLLVSSIAGHTWPGTTISSPLGVTDRSIDANHRMWTFFAKHAR